jgi:hypothetical protein
VREHKELAAAGAIPGRPRRVFPASAGIVRPFQWAMANLFDIVIGLVLAGSSAVVAVRILR